MFTIKPIIFFADHNFGESKDHYTYGKSFCPKGSLYERCFLPADYGEKASLFNTIEFKVAKTDGTLGTFVVKIHKWPVEILLDVLGDDSFVNIGDHSIPYIAQNTYF